jgi:outer membrane lipoprotein-sorting protein
MWIDDALNMPIKSETKSADGTRTVMELSNVRLEADKQLFEIPLDYKKVAFSTLQKQLSARRLNP